MLSSLSLGAIAVIFVGLAAVFHWLGKVPKLRAVLAFAAVCILGFVGWVGHLLADLVTWGVHLVGSVTSTAFGVAVPAVLTVVLLVIFVHDLWPKHAGLKRTTFVGIALASLLVGGASGISALNGIPSTVRSVVSNARTIGG